MDNSTDEYGNTKYYKNWREVEIGDLQWTIESLTEKLEENKPGVKSMHQGNMDGTSLYNIDSAAHRAGIRHRIAALRLAAHYLSSPNEYLGPADHEGRALQREMLNAREIEEHLEFGNEKWQLYGWEF